MIPYAILMMRFVWPDGHSMEVRALDPVEDGVSFRVAKSRAGEFLKNKPAGNGEFLTLPKHTEETFPELAVFNFLGFEKKTYDQIIVRDFEISPEIYEETDAEADEEVNEETCVEAEEETGEESEKDIVEGKAGSEEAFAVYFRFTTQDAAFHKLMKRLIREYSFYIYNKLELDELQLMENMAGLKVSDEFSCPQNMYAPVAQVKESKKDSEFSYARQESIREGSKLPHTCVKDILPKSNILKGRRLLPAQLAISLDCPSIWKKFLELDWEDFLNYYWKANHLEEYSIEENYSEEFFGEESREHGGNAGQCNFYGLKVTHVYIGNQFCPLLFPSMDELDRIFEKLGRINSRNHSENPEKANSRHQSEKQKQISKECQSGSQKQIRRECHSAGHMLTPVIVFAPMPEYLVDRNREIIRYLASKSKEIVRNQKGMGKEGRKNVGDMSQDRGKLELVVNDIGMALLVRDIYDLPEDRKKSFSGGYCNDNNSSAGTTFTLTAGVLINKRKKDVRLDYLNDSERVKEANSENAMDDGLFRAYLRDELGISRISYEVCGYRFSVKNPDEESGSEALPANSLANKSAGPEALPANSLADKGAGPEALPVNSLANKGATPEILTESLITNGWTDSQFLAACMSDGTGSVLHLPMFQMNTSGFCTLYALCKNGSRGKQEEVRVCPRYCEERVVLYPDGLNMTGRWNSLFGFSGKEINDPACLNEQIRDGIGRLVLRS